MVLVRVYSTDKVVAGNVKTWVDPAVSVAVPMVVVTVPTVSSSTSELAEEEKTDNDCAVAGPGAGQNVADALPEPLLVGVVTVVVPDGYVKVYCPWQFWLKLAKGTEAQSAKTSVKSFFMLDE